MYEHLVLLLYLKLAYQDYENSNFALDNENNNGRLKPEVYNNQKYKNTCQRLYIILEENILSGELNPRKAVELINEAEHYEVDIDHLYLGLDLCHNLIRDYSDLNNYNPENTEQKIDFSEERQNLAYKVAIIYKIISLLFNKNYDIQKLETIIKENFTKPQQDHVFKVCIKL